MNDNQDKKQIIQGRYQGMGILIGLLTGVWITMRNNDGSWWWSSIGVFAGMGLGWLINKGWENSQGESSCYLYKSSESFSKT